MSKQKKILLVLVPIVLIIMGYMIYEHLTWVSTDNAQLQGHSVMIAPKVPGFISKVYVEEGQLVEKGAVLAEIDPRDYKFALDIAEGQQGSAEASLREAEHNYKRLKDLVAKGAISQQQFEAAVKNYNDSRAKDQAVLARVEQAKLNLEYTKITAPSKGYIAKKSVEEGQLASAGVPLFGFVDATERWVIANYKETQIDDIHVGNSVEIEVDAIPGRTFQGKVQSLSSATGATFTLLPPDNATGNFTKVVQRIPVKIVLQNLTPKDIENLRAGLSVDARVRRE
jgi:membrane fusion protein (multidrug efflux system)